MDPGQQFALVIIGFFVVLPLIAVGVGIWIARRQS